MFKDTRLLADGVCWLALKCYDARRGAAPVTGACIRSRVPGHGAAEERKGGEGKNGLGRRIRTGFGFRRAVGSDVLSAREDCCAPFAEHGYRPGLGRIRI